MRWSGTPASFSSKATGSITISPLLLWHLRSHDLYLLAPFSLKWSGRTENLFGGGLCSAGIQGVFTQKCSQSTVQDYIKSAFCYLIDCQQGNCCHQEILTAHVKTKNTPCFWTKWWLGLLWKKKNEKTKWRNHFEWWRSWLPGIDNYSFMSSNVLKMDALTVLLVKDEWDSLNLMGKQEFLPSSGIGVVNDVEQLIWRGNHHTSVFCSTGKQCFWMSL